MRWLGATTIAAVVLAGGCAMRQHPDAHTGRDGVPAGARELRWKAVEGILTARGGDRTDWLAFEVPATACGDSEVQVVLHWTPARPGQRVSMTLRDDELEIVEAQRRDSDRAGGPQIAALQVGAPGRFYVELNAEGRDDAGRYSVQVLRDDQTICPPPPPPIIAAPVSPPPSPTPPKTTSIAVALGVAVPPPPAPRVGPAWSPRQAVPLAARAIQYLARKGDVVVVFNRGQAAGVDAGWKATLLDRGGRPSRHTVTLYKVTTKLSYGLLRHTRVQAVSHLVNARLTP